MTSPTDRPGDHTGLVLEERARAAAASLRRVADVPPPDLSRAWRFRWLFLLSASAALAVPVAAVILVAVLASSALPWVVGAVLGVALLGVVAAGVHAGGHGWFVPLPVLALAAAWAVAGSNRGWSAGLVWALAAITLLAALGGTGLVLPALAWRRMPGRAGMAEGLQGSAGTAVTALAPVGVVRVRGESWTARSLSGPLPAGAEVRVVSLEGLRLLVWSEDGSVPGPEVLEPGEEERS